MPPFHFMLFFFFDADAIIFAQDDAATPA